MKLLKKLKEKGLTLPQASKFLKENNLYQKIEKAVGALRRGNAPQLAADSDGESVVDLEAGTRTSDAAGRFPRAWAVRQREARERQKKSINGQIIRVAWACR